ncbi:hypothetical protein ARMGADRAFT_1070417 [Armillaria gallica]|uniref:Uncharacterized protein n=1 Tax=Armillaria gallica TaxID=47427 RepID=A0A2H3EU41_ARMGA|nr:hypothetical protein ARMGADRAFT_1070417 [Armillaria gallica]
MASCCCQLECQAQALSGNISLTSPGSMVQILAGNSVKSKKISLLSLLVAIAAPVPFISLLMTIKEEAPDAPPDEQENPKDPPLKRPSQTLALFKKFISQRTELHNLYFAKKWNTHFGILCDCSQDPVMTMCFDCDKYPATCEDCFLDYH